MTREHRDIHQGIDAMKPHLDEASGAAVRGLRDAQTAWLGRCANEAKHPVALRLPPGMSPTV